MVGAEPPVGIPPVAVAVKVVAVPLAHAVDELELKQYA